MSKITNDKVATIAISTTTSDAVDLDGLALVGLHMPAAFTGTALTFSVNDGEGTYNVLADGAGADVSKTVAASKFINLAPSDFAGVNKIKLISGSSEAAAREIRLVLRDIT